MEKDTLNEEFNVKISQDEIEKSESVSGNNQEIKEPIDKVKELQEQIKKLKKQNSSLEIEKKLQPGKKIGQQKKEKESSQKKEKKNKPKLNVFQRLKRMLNKEKKQNKGKGSEQGVVRVSKSAKNTVVDSFLKPSKGNKKEKTAPKKKRTDTHVKIDYKAFTEQSKHIQKLQRETEEGKNRRGVRGNKTQVKPTTRPSIRPIRSI